MALSFSEEVRAILGPNQPQIGDVRALLEAQDGTQAQRIADAKKYYENPFRKQEEIRQETLDEILKKEAEAKKAAEEAAKLKAEAGMLTGSVGGGSFEAPGSNYYAELEQGFINQGYTPQEAAMLAFREQSINNERINLDLTSLVNKMTGGMLNIGGTQAPAPVRTVDVNTPVAMPSVSSYVAPTPAPSPVVVTPVAPQPVVVGTPLPPISSAPSSSSSSSSSGGGGGGTGWGGESYGGSIAGISGGYSGVY